MLKIRILKVWRKLRVHILKLNERNWIWKIMRSTSYRELEQVIVQYVKRRLQERKDWQSTLNLYMKRLWIFIVRIVPNHLQGKNIWRDILKTSTKKLRKPTQMWEVWCQLQKRVPTSHTYKICAWKSEELLLWNLYKNICKED